MKSQIVIRSLLTFLLVITLSHNAKAQVILNPGEWLALAEGNDLINSQIQSETKSDSNLAKHNGGRVESDKEMGK